MWIAPLVPIVSKKNRPLRDRDTCDLYHTCSFHRVWKKTVDCVTGIHVNCTIPLLPIVFEKKPLTVEQGYVLFVSYPFVPSRLKKTVHCETGIHVNCTIPLFSIVLEKSRLLRDTDTYYLYNLRSFHRV